MNRHRLLALGTILVITGVGVVLPQSAAPVHADAGTLTTQNTHIGYTQGPFLIPNQSDSVGPPICTTGTCGTYTLTVDVPAGTERTEEIRVQVGWDTAYATTAQFDVWVLDASGNPVAQSILGTDPEVTSFPAKAGSYTIEIVPDTPLGLSVHAYVDLLPYPAGRSPNAAPSYSGVYPRFQNYPIPQSLGGNAGEPSIGADWNSGKVMYEAGLQTFRVAFDDSVSPAKTTWTDVSSLTTSRTSLDAILFTDHNTSRTFVSQLTGQDSLTAFTDNDGISWTPSQGGGIPSGVDHETVGGGPYSASAPVPVVTTGGVTGYKDAVYYCSQDIATAFCARSDNGGLTFGAGVPIYALNQCSGIHGHVKVAPDGTVYVPNGNCGGHQAVVVSTDDGLTWAVRPIPDSTPYTGNDPSVGIARDGTVYFGYQGSNGHAYIAVSHDRGLTWSKSQDVGGQLGVQNVVFPAVVAGDPKRAAFAYIGTTTGGNYQEFGVFQGVWHLYISTTYDGGQTWATVDVTPTDPVQRGTICTSGTLICSNTPDDRNLLDFMDVTLDQHGRVLVAYPDGCVGSCVTADPSAPANSTNSFTAFATIARQSGGKSLFAAYDTQQPAAPARPNLTATQTQAGGPVTLRWQAPDNGGSPITSYQIFRGTAPGAEAKYAVVKSGTSFIDGKIKSGVTYYYTLRAVNAYGASQPSPEVTPQLTNTKPMCSLPGQTVLADPQGDQVGAPNNSDLDVTGVSVAEPAGVTAPNGGGTLVFTIQVSQLGSALQPGHQWRVFWDYPDASGARWYVGMDTDATGTPSFIYGSNFGVASPVKYAPGTQSTSNPALAGSGYSPANSSITIVVPKSGFTDGTSANPAPAPGTTLNNVQARTFAGQGDVTASNTGAIDVTAFSTYTVVGNSYCA